MLSSQVKFSSRRTDTWTSVKQYAPNLFMRGHKNRCIFKYKKQSPTHNVTLNPLANNKILDMTKLKAFADDK